jgi:hypothetical protein
MPERVIIAAVRTTHRAVRVTQVAWVKSGPLTPSIVKAILFGLLLWYVQGSGFALWPVFLFVFTAVLSYIQPVSKTFTFSTSFLLVVALALLLTSRFVITLPIQMHAGVIGELLFAGAFGFLFFMLLGIKNMVLSRRREWHIVLFIALIYGISLLFFTSLTNQHPLKNSILIGLFAFLLYREYFLTQEHAKSRALTLISLTLTLLTVELAWVISLLPMGFSKEASVLTLFAMMIASIVDRYLRGTLTARFLRLSTLLVVVLVSVILVSAQWLI